MGDISATINKHGTTATQPLDHGRADPPTGVSTVGAELSSCESRERGGNASVSPTITTNEIYTSNTEDLLGNDSNEIRPGVASALDAGAGQLEPKKKKRKINIFSSSDAPPSFDFGIKSSSQVHSNVYITLNILLTRDFRV